MLVIASPARSARLDAVQADLRRLADPRSLSEDEAEELVRTLPVVSWFLHSVHGDELSSSDAARAKAYHLLAAENDDGVEQILRESIVLIDPLQNPDGRERFIFQNLMARGYPPDTLPVAAEHDETWPSGRVNQLPVRHEPRLDRAYAARDRGARAALARVVPARDGGFARDGRCRRGHAARDLLLSAAGATEQSLFERLAAFDHRSLRARQHGAFFLTLHAKCSAATSQERELVGHFITAGSA